jgi:apolipoprotein N-acyltransferase
MAQVELFIWVGISAVAAALSFISPFYLGFLSFVYLVPLFYAAQKKQTTFWQGFFWGLIFYGLFFFGIFELIFTKAQGKLVFFACIMLTIWSALHAGIWLCITGIVASFFTRNAYITFVWCLTTFLFYFYTCNLLFWPLAGIEIGNCFGWPLLPLAQNPILIQSLWIVGKNALLICLILFQYALLNCMLQKGRAWIIVTIVCMSPFTVGFFKKGRLAPEWIRKIGYVIPPHQTISHPLERGASIDKEIRQTLKQKPNADIFLMPEASCQFCINEYPEILELWSINALKNKTLLIGSPRSDQQKRFNSLYRVEGGRITKYYDKSKLMPLTEYIPNKLKSFSKLRELFLNNKKEFSSKENSNLIFKIDAQLTVVVQLCSEFFFNQYQESLQLHEYPILCAVNDSWFGFNYFKHLMFLFAVSQSILLQKEIIYVGHSNAYWIDGCTGCSVAL